ncbi:hypothetical protein [Vibrio owensii]|uniref:hypothetical protein n=1 Tax=Vibrio owensii TaxID=696485 RepID=UPI0018F22893|nr:hypothetical protein [Vibrio owensii]
MKKRIRHVRVALSGGALSFVGKGETDEQVHYLQDVSFTDVLGQVYRFERLEFPDHFLAAVDLRESMVFAVAVSERSVGIRGFVYALKQNGLRYYDEEQAVNSVVRFALSRSVRIGFLARGMMVMLLSLAAAVPAYLSLHMSGLNAALSLVFFLGPIAFFSFPLWVPRSYINIARMNLLLGEFR